MLEFRSALRDVAMRLITSPCLDKCLRVGHSASDSLLCASEEQERACHHTRQAPLLIILLPYESRGGCFMRARPCCLTDSVDLVFGLEIDFFTIIGLAVKDMTTLLEGYASNMAGMSLPTRS